VDVVGWRTCIEPDSAAFAYIRNIGHRAHERAAILAMNRHFWPRFDFVRTGERGVGSTKMGKLLVRFAHYYGKQRFVFRTIMTHIEKRTYVYFSRLAA
jgi:hypothetical protein